jgi:hypothetical protein
MLKREEILSKTKLRQETVTVEEWGGDVIVSEMAGDVRDEWEQLLRKKDKSGNIVSARAKLVVFTVVDEKGNRVFTEDDIPAIGKLSSEALEKICRVAVRINGLTAETIDEAKKN